MNNVPGKTSPEFPVNSIDDAAAQITADPHCKRAGCYGRRGYTGVQINLDGSRTLLLCPCAKYGETDSVRLQRDLRSYVLEIAKTVDSQYSDIAKRIETIHHHHRLAEDLHFEHFRKIEEMTLIGSLRRIFSRKRSPSVASVPIVGEAQAESKILELEVNPADASAILDPSGPPTEIMKIFRGGKP